MSVLSLENRKLRGTFHICFVEFEQPHNAVRNKGTLRNEIRAYQVDVWNFSPPTIYVEEIKHRNVLNIFAFDSIPHLSRIFKWIITGVWLYRRYIVFVSLRFLQLKSEYYIENRISFITNSLPFSDFPNLPIWIQLPFCCQRRTTQMAYSARPALWRN